MFITQFDRDLMQGIRLRLNYGSVLTYAIHALGITGLDLVDFMERMSLMESEMLQMDLKQHEVSDRRRKAEQDFHRGKAAH